MRPSPSEVCVWGWPLLPLVNSTCSDSQDNIYLTSWCSLKCRHSLQKDHETVYCIICTVYSWEPLVDLCLWKGHKICHLLSSYTATAPETFLEKDHSDQIKRCTASFLWNLRNLLIYTLFESFYYFILTWFFRFHYRDWNLYFLIQDSEHLHYFFCQKGFDIKSAFSGKWDF